MINYSGSTVLAKIFQLIKSKFDSLATVARTGSYNDLKDKPDIGTTSRASVAIASDNTSTIDIPITITDTNQLTVYQNGLILTPTTHYTATTSAITLVGYTANAGDIFTFVGTTESGVSLNASASQVLFSDTTEDGCYSGCTTVQDALIHASEFRSDIKSLSLNGTSYTPNSSGVLSLTNIMKTDTEQTMSAKLIAQNNTDYTTKQVRNIYLVPKSSSDTLPTGSSGDICIIYKDS